MGPLHDFYGYGYVKFTQLHRRGDKIFFEFKETMPGSASLKFLRFLRDEVQNGGDTWACGDFGDVTQDVAAKSGFLLLWEHLLAPPITSNSANVRLRVSLSDVHAEVLDATGNPSPKKK